MHGGGGAFRIKHLLAFLALLSGAAQAASDVVVGVVHDAKGDWVDTKHSTPLTRGSDVLQNAVIARKDESQSDARIEIYLLDGQVVTRNCSTGACANPISIPNAPGDAANPGLLERVKDLLFGPPEVEVPAESYAQQKNTSKRSLGSLGCCAKQIGSEAIAQKDDTIMLAAMINDRGTLDPLEGWNASMAVKSSSSGVKSMIGSLKNRPQTKPTVYKIATTSSDTNGAGYEAELCPQKSGTFAFCNGAEVTPGVYTGKGVSLYVFEAGQKNDCLDGLLKVNALASKWQSGANRAARTNIEQLKSSYFDSESRKCVGFQPVKTLRPDPTSLKNPK